MKKTIVGVFAAALLFTACSTPNYSGTSTSTSSNQAYSTPNNLQTRFAAQYPNATNVSWSAYDAASVPVDWEMNGWSALDSTDYTVSFDMNGQRYYSWYDADGTWVGSTYSVSDYTQLPEAVNKLIKEKYADYSIQKVQQESWKDRTAYEIKLKKSNDDKIKLLVDANGNVLKEKMKD